MVIGVRLVIKACQLKKYGLRTVGIVIGVKRSYKGTVPD